MRRIAPALTVCLLAVALSGCASSSSSPASAQAGRPAGSASPADTTNSPAIPAPATAASSGATSPLPTTTHRASTPPATAASHPARGTAPTSFGYPDSADAKAQIRTALAAAKTDGREVLLDFGASWCGNCVAMDKDFHTPQVGAVLAASYHLVQINADTNMAAISPYDDSSSFGLPVLIVLSPSGAVRVDTNKSGNPSFSQSGFLSFLKHWAA